MLPELRLEMKPELAHLDTLLEDDVLFERVKADLCRTHPNSATLGRHSTPVEVILRIPTASLIVVSLGDVDFGPLLAAFGVF
jgi:hypothetical protein